MFDPNATPHPPSNSPQTPAESNAQGTPAGAPEATPTGNAPERASVYGVSSALPAQPAPPALAGEVYPAGSPLFAPIAEPVETPTEPPQANLFGTGGDFSHRIPRWRWWMSLFFIGTYPALVSLISYVLDRHQLRTGKGKAQGPMLPESATSLVLMLGLDLAIFAALWCLAWLFSRATRDELMLRWRDGAKPIWMGFAYSLALRVGAVMGAIAVFIVLTVVLVICGQNPNVLVNFLKQNSLQPDALFPKNALSNPAYLLLMVVGVSFIAAGLREELWRTTCMTTLRHLFPDSWATQTRWITSILLSSVIFGAGHAYQGIVGVGVTTLLGVFLGAITWRSRSIWPTVFAHGFFDATTFLMVALIKK